MPLPYSRKVNITDILTTVKHHINEQDYEELTNRCQQQPQYSNSYQSQRYEHNINRLKLNAGISELVANNPDLFI
jgi:hypothetical protein